MACSGGPLALSISPLTGRSYRATRDLPRGYCLLDIASPYACTVYKQFRTEVCAECWRYECGTRTFLTCRDYAGAGLTFCNHTCRDAWLAREGEDTMQLLKILEAARMRNNKGNGNADLGAMDCEQPPATDESISQAWEAVAAEEQRPKNLNRWKQLQLDDFEADLARYVLLALIQMQRESQSNTTLVDGHASDEGRSKAHFEGATWRDLAALQSGELQQVGRFPELLQNHLRIYQVLKSRFYGTPPPSFAENYRDSNCAPRLVDLITIKHVRTALAVDPGNSFGIWQAPVTDESEGLGFGIYPTPSFFNHHCSPNVQKERIGRRMRFVTTQEVSAGDSLCIGYGHVEGMGLAERRNHLMEGWFFECQCSRCVAEETAGPFLHSYSQVSLFEGGTLIVTRRMRPGLRAGNREAHPVHIFDIDETALHSVIL